MLATMVSARRGDVAGAFEGQDRLSLQNLHLLTGSVVGHVRPL